MCRCTGYVGLLHSGKEVRSRLSWTPELRIVSESMQVFILHEPLKPTPLKSATGVLPPKSSTSL